MATRRNVQRKVSLSELKAHDTSSDCWIAVRGGVYDVTAFLNDHPGGAGIIVPNAGTDATEAFEDIGHTNYAVSLLDKYAVGQLQGTDEGPAANGSPTNTTKIGSLVGNKKKGSEGGSNVATYAAVAIGVILLVVFWFAMQKPPVPAHSPAK